MRSVIECIPYLDQTKVDEFPSIKERFTLPNKAEPELIKIFQKTKNTAHSTIEEIKKNLIRIKREVIKIKKYFHLYVIIIAQQEKVNLNLKVEMPKKYQKQSVSIQKTCQKI